MAVSSLEIIHNSHNSLDKHKHIGYGRGFYSRSEFHLQIKTWGKMSLFLELI